MSLRRQSQIVKRRRVLLLAICVMLLAMAIGANYRPLRAYFDARQRLATATAGIAELSARTAELQSELGRLSETDYMESLARQDLSYTRPGEELYIVTGADDGLGVIAGAEDSETAVDGVASQSEGVLPDGSPGFLERVLQPILD